ncbi:hypothetical protein [Halobaculum rarum]|uniref:hypothetical protein n=1 Tax=Halobaculum rarum TaxID=3075122 RepID=UPI0032AFAEB6
MTNQTDPLDTFDLDEYGWTKTDDGNYFREIDTFSSGCNICGGTQFEDPDADWYCPHEGQKTYKERVVIHSDIVEFSAAGELIRSCPATPENIKAILRDPFFPSIGE